MPEDGRLAGERRAIARGLWFCGSLCWGLAAASVLAGLILFYWAGAVAARLRPEYWVLLLGGVFSSVVLGYVLKGLSLLVGKDLPADDP